MSEFAEQRKLAAIMFTDMVGYSAFSQRHYKLALELLEEHGQLLRKIFRRFNPPKSKRSVTRFSESFCNLRAISPGPLPNREKPDN